MASKKKLPQDTTSHAVRENDNKGCFHELTGFIKLGQCRVIRIYDNWKNKNKELIPGAVKKIGRKPFQWQRLCAPASLSMVSDVD